MTVHISCQRTGGRVQKQRPGPEFGRTGGYFLPKDMAINKVSFFEIFYYYFCWVLLFPSPNPPPPPGNKILTFWNCTKFTQRREWGVFGLVKGRWRAVGPALPVPLPASHLRCPTRPGAWHKAAPKAGGGTWVQLGQLLQHQYTQPGGARRNRDIPVLCFLVWLFFFIFIFILFSPLLSETPWPPAAAG